MSARSWIWLMALLCSTAGAARAQAPMRPDRFTADSVQSESTTGIAFVASALLPGAGQRYLGSDRWVPFAAVEVWAWVKYLNHRNRGRELERAYRDLAWDVARRITTSSRKDSVFTYYEAMGHYDQSGQFDIDPQLPGVQPELDSATFNGVQWQRARALFLRGIPAIPGTAEYEQALAYYRTHAIPGDYAWSWGTNRLERQAFQETITRSDDAFRNATRMMGVILANHVVAAVDALVQARVKTLREHRIRIGSSLEPEGPHMLWTTTVQIPLHGAERARSPGKDR